MIKRRIHFRALEKNETRLLTRKLADPELRAYVRTRYLIVEMRAGGLDGAAIARRLDMSDKAVRRWISRFNRRGFEGFDRPNNPNGAEAKFLPEHLDAAIGIAALRPLQLMQPHRRWSLRTLRNYLLSNRLIPAVSRETLRRALASRGIRLGEDSNSLSLAAVRRCGSPRLLASSLNLIR